MRVAIDVGSTVIKLARVCAGGTIVSQEFQARDFDAGIAAQVRGLLADLDLVPDDPTVAVCSSANGGLRAGILCLTEEFSGAVLRNQVLAAGGNPLFVHCLGMLARYSEPIDVLVLGGGIDCPDPGPLAERLEALDLSGYRYGGLLYAGNGYLADTVSARWPGVQVVPNPLAHGLRGEGESVFAAVRQAYLDDLVYKEGVSELGSGLALGIAPTPEMVAQGFRLAVSGGSSFAVAGPCLLVDIGGATTDVHYTVEIVRDDSRHRPAPGASTARYVFTDLGIVASAASSLLQLRYHLRTYELLACLDAGDLRESYRLLREGELEPEPAMLAHACLFLALERFQEGDSPGLPTVGLARVQQLVLTGGGAQLLDEDSVRRVWRLFVGDADALDIAYDRDYRIWVDGILARSAEAQA